MQNAISFARQYKNIGDFIWKEKYTGVFFDVALGSFDGVEGFELADIFIMSSLTYWWRSCGSYRDIGLTLRRMNVQQIDLTGKSILHVFNKIEFKIKIQTSLQIVYLNDVFYLKTNLPIIHQKY